MVEPRAPATQPLGSVAVLTTMLTSYYTSAGVTSAIDQCTVTNISNQRVRVMGLHLVPAGQQASDTTAVVVRVMLLPFETYICDEMVNQILASGDSVYGSADQDGVVVLRMSGRVGV